MRTSESEWDAEAFYREVEYGCAVVKLTAGLVAVTALLLFCLGHVPSLSADIVLQPAGAVISHIF